MKKIVFFLIVVFAAALPAMVSAGPKKDKSTSKIKALAALSELPRDVDSAVKSGATEEEIGKAFKKMKEDKVDGEAAVEIAKHFKKQAEEDTDDHGMSDVVHECLAKGKKGRELVACMREDWDKKPKKKKEHKGGPGDHGGPGGPGDEPGQPGVGPVGQVGQVGHEKHGDKDKPDEMGKPEDKEKKHEGKGKKKGKDGE